MLMRCPRRSQRCGESGQALILALAFIAFFGLTVGAVLGVSDVAGQQHALTEATAKNNRSPEGGAAFAAADAGRTDVTLTCVPGNSGLLTMQNTDTATYSVNTCNPSGASSTGGSGENCLLCLLNQTPVPAVFTSNQSVTTTGGNDFINGTIASGSPLTAQPAGANIFVFNGASSAGCVCSPAPLKFAPPILDPFRSGGPAPLGAPSPIAGKPLGCPSWTVTANTGGCDASYSGSVNVTINPGLWHSLSVGGNAKVTLNPGTYVLAGPVIYTGSPHNSIDGTLGVTLYLACANYGSAGNPCPSTGPARTGGYIQISGNGSASFAAPTSGQYFSPTPVVVLSDPNLLDPGGASACYNGGGGCLIDNSGNGASISGTIDLRLGGAEFHGNGAGTINLGRFIANSLFIGGAGDSGLSLTGPGTITTSNCGVYVDGVSASTGTGTGTAVIQSQCGMPKGIIDFNYR